MRVHHLNCGTMRPFGGKLVDGDEGVLRRAAMVCHCLLIETAQGLILVDTGFGTEDVENPGASLPRAFRTLVSPALARAETARAQVVRLGFDPADVRHIIATHLDIDHVGGLRDFPDATVHVYRRELEAATGRNAPMRYRSVHWSHEPNWESYTELSGQRWFGFDAVRELRGLTEDIVLIPLAGHTEGHAGVAVNLGSRWLLHAGDAFFSHQQLATPEGCPPLLRGFQRLVDTHSAQRRSNQRRLHQLSGEHADEVEIFCAHDPTELRRRTTPTTADRE